MRFRFRPPAGTIEMTNRMVIRPTDRVYDWGQWREASQIRGAIGQRISQRAEHPWVRPVGATKS